MLRAVVVDFFFNCWYLEIPSDDHIQNIKVFVPGKFPVKVKLEVLNVFLGELHIIYVDLGARLFSCSECGVDRLASVSFHSPFFKPVLDCKYVDFQFV
jgi:hypothetical protein